MSTILKALKKVESEKENTNSFDPALVAGFRSQQSMQRAVKFAWLKRRSVFWGAIVGTAILLVLGIYAFNDADKQKAGAPVTASVPSANRYRVGQQENAGNKTAGVQNRGSASSPSTGRNTSSSQQVVSALPNAGIDREKVLKMMAGKPAPSGIGQVPATATVKPVTTSKGINQPETAIDHRAITKQLMNRSTSASASEKPKERKAQPIAKTQKEVKPSIDENKAYADAERLTDGRLKVQAIVYADISDERMAVVNNQIVREGSSIDGFSVVGIGENALYVKESGRLMKVQFGTP